MFDIFKPKSPKPTHCWSCEKKFHLFTRYAIKCAGPDCRHTVCHKCVTSMQIYHKKLRFCQLCFANIMSPPTRRSSPRKKTPTSAHAISSPALSPIKSITKTEAGEPQHLEIETPAPRQALSLQEQIAQQRIIIREMEAVMMMNWRRRQDDLATDPLALSVVPKAPSIQATPHPLPHQDSQECSNFKQNPREQVDSFTVSASQAHTKSQNKTWKLSTSAATSNVNGTNGNYKTAASAPQRTIISGNHGVTRLHSKGSSIDVSLSVHHATGASNRSRSQNGRRQRSQLCRPHDV